MTLVEANNIISNLSNYSDDEIIKIYHSIYKTLIDNYCYIEAEEFAILLVKKIKDVDQKVIIIRRYLFSPIKLYSLFKAVGGLCFDEKVKVFKKLFKNYKFESVNELLDIPNNLKFGTELEYSDSSCNAIELLFDSDTINALMMAIGINDDIIDRISKNTCFKKSNDHNKAVFTIEMVDDRFPELSTMVFNNNFVDLNTLKAYYSIMYILKAKVNSCTALHINVGVDYFENNSDCIKYLLSIWGECEELFYKIANKENTVIRSYASDMAIQIKDNINRTLNENYPIKLDNMDDYYRFLYNIQVRDDLLVLLKFPNIEDSNEFEKYLSAEDEDVRYQVFRNMFNYSGKDIMGRVKCKSVNFNHLSCDNGLDGRIEFRMFDNIMDFDTILSNITLIGKVMYVCKELANNNCTLLEKYNNLLNRDVSEEDKLDLLLDLLFDDDKRDIFKRRWESVKDNTYYNRFYSSTETFIPIHKEKQLKKTTF